MLSTPPVSPRVREAGDPARHQGKVQEFRIGDEDEEDTSPERQGDTFMECAFESSAYVNAGGLSVAAATCSTGKAAAGAGASGDYLLPGLRPASANSCRGWRPPQPRAVSSEAVVENVHRTASALASDKLAIALADMVVQAKSSMSQDALESHRCVQAEETIRCRLKEEARSRAVERIADVVQTRVVEEHRLRRHRLDLEAKAFLVEKETELRVKTHQCYTVLGLCSFSLLSSVGRSSKASAYFAGLLLVGFLRQLWSNTASRKVLVWADGLGPFLPNMIRSIMQGSLHLLAKDLNSPMSQRLEAFRRLVAGRPLPGPEEMPHTWVSHTTKDGRVFWHNMALGPAPWETELYKKACLGSDGTQRCIGRPALTDGGSPHKSEKKLPPDGR